MRPVLLGALLAACAAASAPASITVGVLSNGRSTFWLSGPGTQVCYAIPPEDNPPAKALVYATTGGRVEYTQGLPAEASGCVGLAIPLNASMSFEPHTLSVVGAGTSAVASTGPFNVSAAKLVLTYRTNPNNVSITVVATFSNKGERRLTDAVRVVRRDGAVVGECLCYPGGVLPQSLGTTSQAKCTFDILRNTTLGDPTRGPYTIRFHSDSDPQAAAALTPTAAQTANWDALGL